MPEVEARLRTLCRLAGELGIVHGRGGVDYLHSALADVGAAHVSDLRKAELGRLTTALRHEISDRFAEFIANDGDPP